jgi:hypothetical protein
MQKVEYAKGCDMIPVSAKGVGDLSSPFEKPFSVRSRIVTLLALREREDRAKKEKRGGERPRRECRQQGRQQGLPTSKSVDSSSAFEP